MFNYIAPGDTSTFENACVLLIEKFKDVINEHVIKEYFSGNPNDLGGRCAGVPGQVGSNQGGERQGGSLKNKLSALLAHMTKNERQNPYHFIVAMARMSIFHGDLRTFASTPTRTKDDYNIIRDVCCANHLPPEFAYAVCRIGDENNERVRLVDALSSNNIGDEIAIHLPSISRLSTSLRVMLEHEKSDLERAPIAMNAVGWVKEVDWSKPNECIKALYDLTMQQGRYLFEDLCKKCIEDTPEAKVGEDLYSYLRRRAHRTFQGCDGANKRAFRVVSDAIKGKSKKGRKKGPSEKEKQLEAEKWAIVDNNEEGMFGIDADAVDIWAALGEETDLIEDEEELCQMTDSSARVVVPRELGDWTTVLINRKDRTVQCNCEAYNFHRDCFEVRLFEFIIFDRHPPCELVSAADAANWGTIRRKFLTLAKVHGDVLFEGSSRTC